MYRARTLVFSLWALHWIVTFLCSKAKASEILKNQIPSHKTWADRGNMKDMG